MKPILFNTEMVRAIQNGTKVATRRVVKPQPAHNADVVPSPRPWTAFETEADMWHIKPPYRPGDILYVRETWNRIKKPSDLDWHYEYKASCANPNYFSDGFTAVWHPSIHMPREAARIFLRVTGVKVQRVQDITDEECMEEGIQAWTKDGKLYKYYPADSEGDYPACEWQYCPLTPRVAFRKIWNDCYAKPRPVKVKGVIDHYESYPWEDIQETRTYRGKPWRVIGNPWVWVIEFERCEKLREGK